MNRTSGIMNDPSDSCAESFAGFIVTSFSVYFLVESESPTAGFCIQTGRFLQLIFADVFVLGHYIIELRAINGRLIILQNRPGFIF
jgi:hypothetical protein